MDTGKGGHGGPELSANQHKSVVMQRAVLKGQMLKEKLRSAGRRFIKDDKEKSKMRSHKY
jgi:hypothetical protein